MQPLLLSVLARCHQRQQNSPTTLHAYIYTHTSAQSIEGGGRKRAKAIREASRVVYWHLVMRNVGAAFPSLSLSLSLSIHVYKGRISGVQAKRCMLSFLSGCSLRCISGLYARQFCSPLYMNVLRLLLPI